MESLLPVIIMIIIGAIFNSGKKKSGEQQQRQEKPVLPKQPPRKPNVQMTEREKMRPMETKRHENPMDKLKELSREFYKEIQQEFEEAPIKEEKPVYVERKVEQLPQKPVEKIETPIAVEPVIQQPKRKQTASNKPSVIPKTQNDMMQGIIFAEIIGPPKSKR